MITSTQILVSQFFPNLVSVVGNDGDSYCWKTLNYSKFIHSINQEAYISSARYFPFDMFPAALVFLLTQFDISFSGFQVVEYHFRADQYEICKLTIRFPIQFFHFLQLHFPLSILPHFFLISFNLVFKLSIFILELNFWQCEIFYLIFNDFCRLLTVFSRYFSFSITSWVIRVFSGSFVLGWCRSIIGPENTIPGYVVFS